MARDHEGPGEAQLHEKATVLEDLDEANTSAAKPPVQAALQAKTIPWEEQEEQNPTAAQVMSAVRAKLLGWSSPRASARCCEGEAVEEQVQRLIGDAVNPDKLSKMFEGWAPWI